MAITNSEARGRAASPNAQMRARGIAERPLAGLAGWVVDRLNQPIAQSRWRTAVDLLSSSEGGWIAEER